MFWEKHIDSKGKAILITGCDSGFGNRLALRLNSRGFRVYATVLDANSIGAQELIEKCHFKDIMSIIQMDVTNEQQINECYDRIKSELETNREELWAVVNNAGVVTYGPLEWGRFDEFQHLFDVNVFGMIRVTRKFVPMLRKTQGRIVLMSSIGGRVAADKLGAYCMTKASVVAFSDALRREMKKFNIKVVAIEPAVFKTNIYYSFNDKLQNQWENTEDGVKKVYGEDFFHSQLRNPDKNTYKGFGGKANSDIEIVIEDMIKAITAVKPKKVYRPIKGTMTKLLFAFVGVCPQWVIDRYFQSLDKNVPQSMKAVEDVKVDKA